MVYQYHCSRLRIVLAYVDIDKVTETGEALGDSEIINMVRPESDSPQPESEEDEAHISPCKINSLLFL